SSPGFMQSRRLVGTKQRPFSTGFNPLHKQIWYPQRIEQIPCPELVLPMVLSQIQEREDIGGPGLEIRRKRALPFSSCLIHITCRVVKDPQHGNNAVACSVRPTNIGTGRADIMDR